MASANSTLTQSQYEREYKLHIAIDFGTDGLGLAYATGNDVFVHSKWNSEKYGDDVKPKTIILLDKDGNEDAFGSDAKELYMKLKSKKDHMLFERFKMSLYEDQIKKSHHHKANEDEKVNHKIDIKTQLTADNGRKYPSESVFIQVFKHIQKETKSFLRKKKIKVKKRETQWIITVPAIWNDRAKNRMKQWITKAGLVNANDKTQCKIVYEPDCASLAIHHGIKSIEQNNTNDPTQIKFSKGENYILVDAGAGTVDIACHQIMGEFGVREILPPSGGPWGSAYIDDQYKQTLDRIFGDDLMREFKGAHPNIYMYTMDYFQRAKADFDGRNTHHNCRLPHDFIAWMEDKFEDDEDVQEVEDIIRNCELHQSNWIELTDEILQLDTSIWMCMFDAVIDPMVAHVKQLLCEKSMVENCKYLCLVGGLSCSPYFQNKMRNVFGEQSKYKLRLIIPQRPILSVVHGAAYFGITKNYIKARRVAKTYGIGCNYSIEEALERGVSRTYIDEHKDRPHPSFEYEVLLFHPIINKGTEVWTNQVFEGNTLYRPNRDRSCTITILANTEVDPTLYSTKDIVAECKMYFEPTDPADAPLNVEWHFYDTTIKIIYYLKSRPQDKREMQIAYDSTDN
eukprot:27761_1